MASISKLDASKTPSSSETGRRAPIALDSDAFRALGHRLVDRIAERLAAIPGGRVTPGETPSALREALGSARGLPEQGADPQALLDRATDLLFDHSLFNGHPRFFGYITASPAPIGILADLLASAVNPNVGAWTLAPAASEIEVQTVRWVAELIGYPAECGGLMVSGGNMANLVGFFAARAAGADWGVREKGVAGANARPLRMYVSAETHTWIQKAADLSGLGTDSIRWIETDSEQRMEMGALRRAIAADRARGDRPFLVVGTGGSVSTGAVDPLPEIAALCREEKLWFHVDGAYGALAAKVPGAPAELRALAEADSVAVDPHKWMYSPLEAGCALVRDPEALVRAFSYHPPYFHLEEQVVNFVDYGPQNSRGFRALKVWLSLQHVGAAGHRRMIAEDIELARVMAAAVERHPELETATQGLSIVTFRFVPPDLRSRVAEPEVEKYLNDLNHEVLDRSQRGGEAFVSNAVIRGRYLLRACIVNFHTSRADVEATPEILAKLGRQLDGELRPAALGGRR